MSNIDWFCHLPELAVKNPKSDNDPWLQADRSVLCHTLTIHKRPIFWGVLENQGLKVKYERVTHKHQQIDHNLSVDALVWKSLKNIRKSNLKRPNRQKSYLDTKQQHPEQEK